MDPTEKPVKRETRPVQALILARPLHSQLLGLSVVELNINEARAIVQQGATVVRSGVYNGRKTQFYLYNHRLYVCMAGWTTASETDDYPIHPGEVEIINFLNNPARVA